MPCIWLAGTKALTGRGTYPTDATNVVSNNTALFLKMYGNFYGADDEAAASAPVETRHTFACNGCGKQYGNFPSSIEAGLSIGSYPPVCQRCGDRVVAS